MISRLRAGVVASTFTVAGAVVALLFATPMLHAAPAKQQQKERLILIRLGDRITYPAANVTCTASAEGGDPTLICHRKGSHKYSVYFYRNNLFVYQQGHPDDPVFAANGHP